MANPTAPPNTPTASQPQLLVLGAKPVCKPPAAAVVVPAAAPAVPLGVATELSLAAMMATVVMVDWLPFGRVVVCTTTLVKDDEALAETWEAGAEAPDAVDIPGASDEPESVITPPSIVVTIVTPAAFVVVTTAPEVNETELALLTGPGPSDASEAEDVAEVLGTRIVVVAGVADAAGTLVVAADSGTGVAGIVLLLLGSTGFGATVEDMIADKMIVVLASVTVATAEIEVVLLVS